MVDTSANITDRSRGAFDISALKKWGVLIAVIWFLIIGLSFLWSLVQERNEERHIAEYQGRMAFSRDLTFRRWNAEQGGVYGPITKKHPPNPYLDVPEKIISTPSGRKLTLINPAYMMRQLYEIEKKGDELPTGRITSLKALNPKNAPDTWETAALETFETGAKEKSELINYNGKPHLRLMRVLYVEKSCLKCHEKQGYKAGEVRGGISVVVPMEPIRKSSATHILWIYLVHIITLILGWTGLAAGLSVIGTRIRERQKLDEELAQRTRELETFMNNLPGMAYRCRNDIDWTLEFVSPGCLELTGYAPQALINNRDIAYADIIHPEDRAQVWDNVQNGLCEKAHFFLEYRIVTASGAEKWVFEQGQGVFSESGELLFLEGIVMDSTARKFAELALKDASAFNSQIISGVAEGVVVFDLELNYLLWNPFMENLTGMEASEVVGKNAFDLFPHIKDNGVDKLLERALKGEAVVSDDVYFTVPKTGKSGWAHSKYSPYRDSSGKVSGVLGVVSDITERKENELLLRESEKRYRSFVSNFFGIAFRIKMDLSPVFFHGAVEEITGFTENDFISGKKMWTQMIHPVDLVSLRDDIEKIVDVAGNSALRDYRIICKDRSIRWVREKVQVIFDDNGEAEYLQGAIVDITENKMAEFALAENEQRYRLLAETMPDIMYVIGRDGKVTYSNKTASLPFDPTGKAQDELFPPESAGRRMRNIGHIFETGSIICEEETLPSPVGNIIFENRLVPMRNVSGEIEGVLEIMRDITVSRKTEEMLRNLLECSSRESILDFMDEFVKSLAAALNVKYVFATKIVEGEILEAMSFWDGESLTKGQRFNISGSPCEKAIQNGAVAFTRDVPKLFSESAELKRMEAVCYLGAPLLDSAGKIWGVIAAIDVKPFPDALVTNAIALVEIMASRVTAEFERGKAIEALQRSESRLRALSRNMIALREEDRRTVAQELHDELGQKLAALYLEIECMKSIPNSADSFVEAAKGILKNANEDLKRIYHRLRPITIDKLGLSYALESLLREFRQHSGMEVVSEIAPVDKSEISSERAITLYRILQELLTNAAKHSGASRLIVRLERESDCLKMHVEDNGAGFSHELERGHVGFGLIGMKERSELFGGELKINSAPGAGASTDVIMPLKGNAEPEEI